MLQRILNSFRRNPGRLALTLAVLLGMVNTLLIATALFSDRSANRLAYEVVELKNSLAQLRQVEQEGLQDLEQEALASEAELETLKGSFPQLGESFDLYRRGFALAEANLVDILGIETGSSSFEETPVGMLEITTYRVDASAPLANCIGLLGALEMAGLETLALDQLFLSPADETCNFEVILASAVPAKELPGLTEEVETDG